MNKSELKTHLNLEERKWIEVWYEQRRQRCGDNFRVDLKWMQDTPYSSTDADEQCDSEHWLSLCDKVNKILRKAEKDWCPKGYQRILWQQAVPEQEVYLLGSVRFKDGPPCYTPHAYGPHFVFSIMLRKLWNQKNKSFTHHPEELLIKKVVTTTVQEPS